jgi:hypothetical protein
VPEGSSSSDNNSISVQALSGIQSPINLIGSNNSSNNSNSNNNTTQSTTNSEIEKMKQDILKQLEVNKKLELLCIQYKLVSLSSFKLRIKISLILLYFYLKRWLKRPHLK